MMRGGGGSGHHSPPRENPVEVGYALTMILGVSVAGDTRQTLIGIYEDRLIEHENIMVLGGGGV